MVDRSNRPEVRNPVLALPEAQRLAELCPHCREIVRDVHRGIARVGRERANRAWDQNKGPMAVYWKCVNAWFGHIARAIGRLA